MPDIVRNISLPTDLRQKHNELNFAWISEQGLIGFEYKEHDDIDETIRLDASPYAVCWHQNINRLCHMLPADFVYQNYTLVDVGCGSAISTIYFLKTYPFKSFLGFDFSPSLLKLAKFNKKHIGSQGTNISNFVLESGDAKTYQLPDQPMVLFLFNPFGWQTMEPFLNNNINVLRKNNCIMLYVNDVCINEIAKVATVLSRDEFFNLAVISFG